MLNVHDALWPIEKYCTLHNGPLILGLDQKRNARFYVRVTVKLIGSRMKLISGIFFLHLMVFILIEVPFKLWPLSGNGHRL